MVCEKLSVSSFLLSQFHFRVPVNCPQTFSEFIPGLNNVWLGSLIVALNGVAMALGLAVTSVPVSILNVTGTSFMYRSTSHFVMWQFVECIVPKNCIF